MENILFVVEGEDREIKIFNQLNNVFFKNRVKVLPVPVGMNIYMLWEKINDDLEVLDIVEILRELDDKCAELLEGFNRESFSEVYYFFDFDEHSNNIPEKGKDNINVLCDIFDKLDNETELGKLYISYPMIESFRDFVEDSCRTISDSCFVDRNDFVNYKNISSKNPQNNDLKKYNYEKWVRLIENYIYRCACLFRNTTLDRLLFVDQYTPLNVFMRQIEKYKESESIFILSAIPEFLIDYYESIWNKSVGKRKNAMLDKTCKEKK